MNPEEARIALNEISAAENLAVKSKQFSFYYLLIWGTVWTVGFLINQLWQGAQNGIWVGMLVGGITASGILGALQGSRTRAMPGTQTAFMTTRLALIGGMLYGFMLLWLLVFRLTGQQAVLLWVTVTMFNVIVTGFWTRLLSLILLGFGVTVLMLLGYYLLPQLFWFWAALFAGLPLFGMGVYGLSRLCRV